MDVNEPSNAVIARIIAYVTSTWTYFGVILCENEYSTNLPVMCESFIRALCHVGFLCTQNEY